jgi:hypothetical protein
MGVNQLNTRSNSKITQRSRGLVIGQHVLVSPVTLGNLTAQQLNMSLKSVLYRRRGSAPANRRCVEIALWREEAIKRGLEQNKTENTAKRGFSRSRQDLQQMDITREFEAFVWKVDPDADKLDK